MAWGLGTVREKQGRLDEAEALFLTALEGQHKVLADDARETLASINSLIELYDAWDKPEQAQQYREMLEAIEAKKAETTEPAVP